MRAGNGEMHHAAVRSLTHSLTAHSVFTKVWQRGQATLMKTVGKLRGVTVSKLSQPKPNACLCPTVFFVNCQNCTSATPRCLPTYLNAHAIWGMRAAADAAACLQCSANAIGPSSRQQTDTQATIMNAGANNASSIYTSGRENRYHCVREEHDF